MTVGGSAYLTATVCPTNATCPCVTWCSSNTSVATVNPTSGLVMAQGVGTATIYATAQDGSGKQGSCIIYCDICTCCDTYTNELIETFGFTNSDALLIRSLYDKIDDKFSSESDLMKAWRCSRLLGGIVYTTNTASIKDKIQWTDTSGIIFPLGETEQEHFTNTLGYTTAEYLQLKNVITLQHEDSSTPDFAHMQISLAARLAYSLDKDLPFSNFGTIIYTGSFASDEDVSYLAGWLGDAVLRGMFGKNGTTFMKDDDYCADLDAENIYRYIIEGQTSVNAISTYYTELTASCTRADKFLNYISYSTVEEKIFYELIDKGLRRLMSSEAEQGNISMVNYYLDLINNEQYHWDIIKRDYPDTYNFLHSLKDGLAHMTEYC